MLFRHSSALTCIELSTEVVGGCAGTGEVVALEEGSGGKESDVGWISVSSGSRIDGRKDGAGGLEPFVLLPLTAGSCSSAISMSSSMGSSASSVSKQDPPSQKTR